jgi:uridine kinase
MDTFVHFSDLSTLRLIQKKINHCQMNRPIVVGITGAAGTGKTTLGINLTRFLGKGNCLQLDLDDYQYSRQDKQERGVTGQDPEGTKRDKLRADLQELKKERPAFKPCYEFKTGNILSEVKVDPKKHIFITGTSAMFDGIREECDLTVFLDAPESLLLARRLKRDVEQRGYSVGRVMRLLPELRKDYEKFIEPVKGVADLAVGMEGYSSLGEKATIY